MLAARGPLLGDDLEVPGYRLLRRIASGGMGSVYEAERLTTGGHFAIKVVRPELLGDATFIARFEREVRALRSIRHPNVVDIFEWRVADSGGQDVPFVVMELLAGESLAQLLGRMERMRAGQVVAVMLQVLDGLAAAHEIGVIHRDLGPSNIFLSVEPGGRLLVKLLDFGLARPVDDGPSGAGVTQKGMLVGKPGYVAPEMFRGEHLDARADLFACGMLMFWMLTGELPYRERQSDLLWGERYAEREAGREYPGPRTLQPDVPEALDAIVARAIRKRPADRYASARAMQSVLLPLREAGESWEAEITTTVLAAAELARRVASPSVPAAHPDAPPLRERDAPQGMLRPSDRAAQAARELKTQEVSGTAAFTARESQVESLPGRGRRLAKVAAVVVGVAVVVTLLALALGRTNSSPGGGPLASQTADVPVGTLASAAPATLDPAPTATEHPDADAANQAPPMSQPSSPAPDVAATAEASAPLLAAPTVRLTFVGVPGGAEVRVDGRPVTGTTLDVPRSSAPVRVSVVLRGSAYRPFVQDIVPTEGREVRVRLQRASVATGSSGPTAEPDAASAARDAGPVQGRFGTVFALDFDKP
jgi:serine/threonine protein kinase